MGNGIYICNKDPPTLVWYSKLTAHKYRSPYFINDVYNGILLDATLTNGFHIRNALYMKLSFRPSGIINFTTASYKWYFKSTLDAVLVVLHTLKCRLGKDLTRLVAERIWRTRNDLVWK